MPPLSPRSLASLAAAALCTSLLAGCGGAGDETEASPSRTGSEESTSVTLPDAPDGPESGEVEPGPNEEGSAEEGSGDGTDGATDPGADPGSGSGTESDPGSTSEDPDGDGLDEDGLPVSEYEEKTGSLRSEIAAATPVATDFIEAFTERSFDDGGPEPWLERVEPFVTDGYFADLRRASGEIRDDYGDEWELRTSVDQAVVSDWYQLSSKRMSFSVVYRTQLLNDGQASGDAQPQSMFVHLVDQGGEWVVRGVDSTGDRR